jgi:hypothetical protein
VRLSSSTRKAIESGFFKGEDLRGVRGPLVGKRLWQPGPYVLLAPLPRGAQPVEAEPGDHCREVRLRGSDLPLRRASQRTNASCVTSSASMTLPSILYAIENSKGRYWSYVLSSDLSSAL